MMFACPVKIERVTCKMSIALKIFYYVCCTAQTKF